MLLSAASYRQPSTLTAPASCSSSLCVCGAAPLMGSERKVIARWRGSNFALTESLITEGTCRMSATYWSFWRHSTGTSAEAEAAVGGVATTGATEGAVGFDGGGGDGVDAEVAAFGGSGAAGLAGAGAGAGAGTGAGAGGGAVGGVIGVDALDTDARGMVRVRT